MQGVSYIRFSNWCVNMIGVVNVKYKLYGISKDLAAMHQEINLINRFQFLSLSYSKFIYIKPTLSFISYIGLLN